MKNDDSTIRVKEIYEKERPMYDAWGNYVSEYIMSELKKKYVNIDSIIKIPVSYRSKDVESLIDKAFYREKNYNDPYNDITDKVGTRFVVMAEQQIKVIQQIVESCIDWKWSMDIDYNQIRALSPDVFTYQSIHYIVKNSNKFSYDGHIIENGIACEIQIRTLEQHAYAEISHDLFYKKNEQSKPEPLRLLARSAAFNEASDELFRRMYVMTEQKNNYYNNVIHNLSEKYNFKIASDKLNKTIFDDIYEFLVENNIDLDMIVNYLDSKTFIQDRIKEKQRFNILFYQPVVLILYYLADNFEFEFINVWKMPERDLELIYSDLGKSL